MQNEIKKRLSENIRKYRKEKKMTQFELAEKANLSEAMIKSIETCHAWPSENTLLQISNALETDVYHLFLPVAASVSLKEKIHEDLKKTIKERFSQCVSDILSELE